MTTLAPARPIHMGLAQAAYLRDGIVAWSDPLEPCCLVAIHNVEPCYKHRWPLAFRYVTHLPPDYFSDEWVADREEARRAEWRYAWDW